MNDISCNQIIYILDKRSQFKARYISIFQKTIENTSNSIKIDTKIININEIDFIIKRLKESPLFNNTNIKFELFYRSSRDGEDTVKLHQICDGKKNVIIFMKSEQGNCYGGFSNIGWETRTIDNLEWPVDDNAFLFSLNNKKIFNAIKGKNKICWISNEYGLSFSGSLTFSDKFLTKSSRNLYKEISENFENCTINDFNSGITHCKLSELEVFQIK